MKIVIGSDKSGLELKAKLIRFLVNKSIDVLDVDLLDTDDYPDIAVKVCNSVLEESTPCKGILICGTGMGMCIVANKIKNIRATLCSSVFNALKSRTSNDANILTLGSLTTGVEIAKNIVDVWTEDHNINPGSLVKLKKIKELDNL